MSSTRLIVLFTICLATCQLLNATPELPHSSASTLTGMSAAGSVLDDIDYIRQQIYSFWQRHGPDMRYGGFHGTLDRSGAAMLPTAKDLVQETRHIWAFSTYHLFGYDATATADRHAVVARLSKRQAVQQQHLTSKQMAKSAYDFVVKHMHDPSSSLFHWNVTQDGQVIQDNKVIYGQWFVLYSFSQYYNAFRDRHARELALQCFRAMDAAWHSSLYGGYDELPENAIPPSPEPSKGLGSGKASRRELVDTAATSHATDGSDQAPTDHSRGSVMVQHKANGQQPAESARGALRMTRSARRARPEERGSADAARLEAPEKPLRSLNIAMHGLEALTALHKVTKDPLLLIRIREYLDILCRRLQRSAGLIFEEYVPAAAGSTELWTPAPGTVVNHGHNLESTWLVADTLDYLDSIAAISPEVSQEYRATAMSIGAAAVRDGYDMQHGGVYESGSPTTGPQSKIKVWWVQAEAMLALWKLHQYYDQPEQGGAGSTSQGDGLGGSSGSAPSYLEVLAHTVSFVREHQTDAAGGGEQFWQVDADGTWRALNDIDRDTKGNRWKASYHNSRSVLLLEQWMKAGS